MKVRIGLRWSIVIHDDVHPFDINASAENIGGDKDTLFEGLERGVSSDAKQNRQGTAQYVR
jgi:hypothetical protein